MLNKLTDKTGFALGFALAIGIAIGAAAGSFIIGGIFTLILASLPFAYRAFSGRSSGK